MSWQDRDYSDDFERERTTASWLRRRPPPATLTLIILHGAAFALMLMLLRGKDAAVVQMLALKGAESYPLGILLHPIATVGILTALFTVLALWSLGGRLEPRMGAGRLVGFYVLGNLAAGATYFGVARVVPGLAITPLDSPLGALAAMCLVAWRRLRNEPALVFGHVTSTGQVYAICAAVVVGLALLTSGAGGLAWLLAAAAGSGGAVVMEYWPALRIAPRRREVRSRPSLTRAAASHSRADEDDVYIDDILAKISRQGLGALTKAERQRLEAARQEKLRRSHQEV